MNNTNNNSGIGSHFLPGCTLCKLKGEILYEGLTDKLFGSLGSWDLFRCPDKKCGLLWLNPAPIKEDIHKAYNTYYTHGDAESSLFKKIIHTAFAILKKLNCPYQKSQAMYLGNTKKGKLLEIGCGNGKRLKLLKNKGWQVEGIEIDPKAAKVAQSNCDCKIHTQDLLELNIPENSFDAIVMNHVIEHVINPIELLKGCRKALKPEGRLIIVTPNSESFGHKYFKKNWSGLDAPRHLFIYSVNTLKQLSAQAQFNKTIVWTTSVNADMLKLSYVFKSPPKNIIINNFNKMKAIFLIHWESLNLIFNKGIGEECVLIAKK